MGALVAALTLVATLAGVGVGFVWWGLPLQRLRDDVDSLMQRAAGAERIHTELERVKARLKMAQAELGRERELRARLDAIAAQGRR
jgi:hypothetical protein